MLTDLTETIRKAIDDNEFACGVFLDFKKSFDTVNHESTCLKMFHLLFCRQKTIY